MGGGGGSSDSTTTMYTNLLPTYIPGVQEMVEDWMAAASALSSSNFSAYPDPTYADLNADEVDGIDAVAVRGGSGSAIELDGKTILRNLYDGLYINVNPKISAAYAAQIAALLEEFDEETLPQVRGDYAFAWGGSEHNIAEARVSKKMMAKINEIAKQFYDDYTNERSLQQQGMAHATPYGLQCIRDMEMLRMAGVYDREFSQGALVDDWQRWNEEIILPVRNLDILGNAVRTVLSTYRQQTTQYYKPPVWAQIAGLAITGLSLYSMFSGTSLSPYVNPGMKALGAGEGFGAGWGPAAPGPNVA